ncbi:hypothetical protein ACFCYX_18115 [Streptomyces populi]|uniref:hypothetical protein n=1 Tax=Streptomyces populi TaxID=2058924 RepID=UPI001F0BC76F|nr:hypothetical protein [Streptomyces populi]
MADETAVIGGVDTHADFPQAAVIDSIGRHLATQAFPATPDGYHRLLDWLCTLPAGPPRGHANSSRDRPDSSW